MDAVELPLPAKVDFREDPAPAAAVEGVDAGPPEEVAPEPGAGGEVLRRAPTRSAPRRDVKQHNQNVEGIPSYRSKRTSLEVSMQKSFGLDSSLKTANGIMLEMIPFNPCISKIVKIVAKKTIKLLDGPPCSKRPKLEPVQTAGLANFDSGFSGNGTLGSHGLKSDVRDITNHIGNLSLSELLDGTYKYSCLGRIKERRKAFSMLSDMDYCYGKDSNLVLSPKFLLQALQALTSKSNVVTSHPPWLSSFDLFNTTTQDSSQINICDTLLCHPKDILSRLTLPHVQDLDSVLAPGSESITAVKPSMPSMTSMELVCHHFLGHSHGRYEDLSVHKIDDLLQEMDAAKLSIVDSCDGRYNLCGMESTSGSLVQNFHSRKIGTEHGSHQLQPLDHGDSLDGFQKHDSEHSLLKTPQASPKVQRAAEILCDMKRSTESWSAQGYSNGAIKWPKSPSEKVMKARKPSPQFGTAESSSGSRNNDATWNGSNHSTKKIVDRKNDSVRLNNPGKGTIRWPVPIEDGASPVRSERGLIVDTRQPHGNGGRHPVQVSSLARLEKEYENQQKLRKATLTSSLGSAGDWNRERNRRT
ncbi:hypothetical protein BS78_K123300 [Paspalum vaginatum]|uniref:Uncharacterized protein n=1 Tax=Paspalum vaginatum TaxID=158149 RepID=A0A9W8CCX6_9POAL|nr:hypothetical protein BS78_K123300 [Paspalum vaginatum]